jgi:hypothetical protein
MPERATGDRMLSSKERRLLRWMLEHGTPEASSFLRQAGPCTIERFSGFLLCRLIFYCADSAG